MKETMKPIGGKLHHRGFEGEDVARLIEAHDWMAGLANRDCDCDMSGDGSQLDNPCDVCQARRAMDSLAKVIDPTPITLHPNRLKNIAELVYYELWEKENERRRGLNSGFTLIEHLLMPEGQKKPDPVSQHDMAVATTVIQWLGTNCGRGFVDAAEKEIKKRNAIRSEFGTHGMGHGPEAYRAMSQDSLEDRVAESIASQFISKDKHDSAYRALRMAIVNALVTIRKKERDEILSAIGSKQPITPGA